MTQADSVHSTPPTNTSLTRRNMLGAITAAAASLPIAAAVPTAAPAMAPNAAAAGPVGVDPMIALAERTSAAWNDFEAKCSVTSKAEDAVIDWRNLNPQPKHETALNEWGAKKRLVERETGYTRAEQAQERASEHFGEIRDELVYARPVSIAGLRAKAAAAKISSDEDLQQQIVFDIGLLFGDLDSNERPVPS
jgi:hypothetical protein